MSYVPTRAEQAPTGGRRTLALFVILLAAFLDLIGVTILNVATPTIQTDLPASPAHVQWIQAGYTLALALGMVTGARLGDLLGHKRVFVAGIVGFAATSALCALAVNADMLVAARVLQGLCAAAMIPQVLSQIQVMYAPRERGGPMAAFSALAGLAATLGPILGPLLLEWGSSWRLVFWVNVPIAVLAVVACLKLLPASRATAGARVDLVGVVLSAVGLFLLLYPLISSADRGHWPIWTYACVAAGLAVLAGFVAHQRWVGVRGGVPLVEMSLFRFRSMRGGLLVQLLFFVPTMGFFLVFMLFLQVGIGMGPLAAGLAMLPWSVAVPIFATLSAALLLPRIGRMTTQLGLVVMALGFALLAYVAAGAGPATGWTDLVWGVLLGGAGMGLLVAPLTQLTLSDVPVAGRPSPQTKRNIKESSFPMLA